MANRIASIVGIVNGTSNFILTRMSERRPGLRRGPAARRRPRASPRLIPTLDVGGGDSAHKISLLASFAFGGWIDYRELLCEGITGITAGEIEFASSAGFVFKLLASARWNDGRPAVTVFPALVPQDHPLAFVRGEMNAVMTQSDFMGPAVFVGKGAGGNPTASSVASDLGDLLRHHQCWQGAGTRPSSTPPASWSCSRATSWSTATSSISSPPTARASGRR